MNIKLSEKQLSGYRQWLAELDAEAQEPGGDLRVCDREIWEYFDPKGEIGRQVYESYTDEELLDRLIETMRHPGRSPRYEQLYCVYKAYLKLRFNGLHNAKDKARARMKRLEDQEKWPPDWHERVSVQPLVDDLTRRGRELTGDELLLLERLCQEARKTGLPPHISLSIRKRLEPICPPAQALERMGIPILSKTALKHMSRYWSAERRNPTAAETAGT